MKIDEIDRILTDLMAGESISSEDRQILENWEKSSERNLCFEREIRQLVSSGASLKGRRGRDEVWERVKRRERTHGRIRLLRKFSVAASIVLFLCVTIYMVRLSQWQEERVEQVPVVTGKSGMKCAELILPRGEVIRLDSASNVLFVADSLTRVINDGNTLIYKAGEDDGQVEYHTIRVPRGGEYNLQLADGSKVYLNAGSSLCYPVRFVGDRREVTLTGEGYFEVVKDSTQPFIVKAGDIDVRVLGTTFNVNAYSEKEVIATTLVEGKVQVNYRTGHQVITPGMQLVYDKQDGKVNVREVDTEVYTSWKDGYYYFKREALENIMDVLVQWYDLNVFYQHPDLKSLEFGGRLKRYEDIRYLLKKMEETHDVEFIIKGKTITVKRKTD